MRLIGLVSIDSCTVGDRFKLIEPFKSQAVVGTIVGDVVVGVYVGSAMERIRRKKAEPIFVIFRNVHQNCQTYNLCD